MSVEARAAGKVMEEAGLFNAVKGFMREPRVLGPEASLPAGITGKEIVQQDLRETTRKVLARAGRPGLEAQQALDKYGTNVVYTKGGGYFYDHPSNTVHVDLDQALDPAVQICHEARHAVWSHEGWSANLNPLAYSRGDYITRMLHEETDTSTQHIYANLDMQRANPNLPHAPLQTEFTNGYNAAAQRAEQVVAQQGRVLTPEERAIAGDQGGRSAVFNSYANGHVATSVDGTPYPMYYGNSWDRFKAGYDNWYQQYGKPF